MDIAITCSSTGSNQNQVCEDTWIHLLNMNYTYQIKFWQEIQMGTQWLRIYRTKLFLCACISK